MNEQALRADLSRRVGQAKRAVEPSETHAAVRPGTGLDDLPGGSILTKRADYAHWRWFRVGPMRGIGSADQ